MIYRYGGGSFSASLTISASITDTFGGGPPLGGGPYGSVHQPKASAFIGVSLEGASVNLERIVGSVPAPPRDGDDGPPPPNNVRIGYRVTLSGYGQPSVSADVWLAETGPIARGQFSTASGTFTGKLTVSFATERRIEIAGVGNLSIIDAPFPLAVRLFEVGKGNATATMTGVDSISGSVDGQTISYEASAAIGATAVDGGGGTWSVTPGDENPNSEGFFAPAQSLTYSDAYGTGTASAGMLSLSATTIEIGNTVNGQSGAAWNLTKSFALSGVVRAMEQAYPDALVGTCSKFLGDTDTDFAIAGGAFGLGGLQRRGNISVGISTRGGGDSLSIGVDEWQPISCQIKAASLSAVGDDERATRLLMRGKTFAGITLAKSNVTVDAGNSLTPSGAWSGNWEAVSGGAAPTVAGGGVSFTGSARRSFAHDVSFTGSRHLRLTLKASAANAPFSLSIDGKSWSAKAGADTSQFVPIDIDLAAETNQAATTSTHDTKWPLQRNDDLTGDDLPMSEGPYFGVQRVGSLTLSGAAGVSFVVQKVELVTKGGITADAVPTFYRGIAQYRNGAPIGIDEGWPTQQYPDRHFGTDGGGTSTYAARRGLLVNADGVQMEQEDSTYQIDVPPGDGGDPTLTASEVSLLDLVNHINKVNAQGTILNPGYVATSAKPFPTTGCDIDIPDFDACYLNEMRPAAWLFGAGAIVSKDGWQFGFDKELGAIGQAQQGFDSIEWFPGCGDELFGFGGNPASGPGSGTLQLRAAAILHGAAHGLTLKANKKPATGRLVSLLQGIPAPGPIVSHGMSKASGFYTMHTSPFAKTVQPGTVQGVGTSVNVSALYGRKRQRVVLISSPNPCHILLVQDAHYFPFMPQFSDPAALPYENVVGLTSTQAPTEAPKDSSAANQSTSSEEE